MLPLSDWILDALLLKEPHLLALTTVKMPRKEVRVKAGISPSYLRLNMMLIIAFEIIILIIIKTERESLRTLSSEHGVERGKGQKRYWNEVDG